MDVSAIHSWAQTAQDVVVILGVVLTVLAALGWVKAGTALTRLNLLRQAAEEAVDSTAQIEAKSLKAGNTKSTDVAKYQAAAATFRELIAPAGVNPTEVQTETHVEAAVKRSPTEGEPLSATVAPCPPVIPPAVVAPKTVVLPPLVGAADSQAVPPPG